MLGQETMSVSANKQLVLQLKGQDWQLCTRHGSQTVPQSSTPALCQQRTV